MKTPKDRGFVTPRQRQVLELLAAEPGLSTTEIAKRLGCSQTNVYDICDRLLALGYMRRSGTLVIGPRCGTCPHCSQPVYRPELVQARPYLKLSDEKRRAILLSRGKAVAIAARFGVSERFVRKLWSTRTAQEVAHA